MTDPIIGHIGYSPDYKSTPDTQKLPGHVFVAPVVDKNGDMLSADIVRNSALTKASGEPVFDHSGSAGATCTNCESRVYSSELCKVCATEEENSSLRDELDRLSDLVWANTEVIDFTGFEDIKEAIDKARDG